MEDQQKVRNWNKGENQHVHLWFPFRLLQDGRGVTSVTLWIVIYRTCHSLDTMRDRTNEWMLFFIHHWCYINVLFLHFSSSSSWIGAENHARLLCSKPHSALFYSLCKIKLLQVGFDQPTEWMNVLFAARPTFWNPWARSIDLGWPWLKTWEILWFPQFL